MSCRCPVGRPATRPWECAPEPSILLRILEEIDDLNQLRLGFIDASDIGKGHASVLLHEYLGTALADAQEATHALLLGEAAEQEEPDAEEGHRRQNPGEHITQPGAFHHPRIGHVVLGQPLGQVGFDTGGHDGGLAPAVRRFQVPGDRAVRHQHFGDAPLGQRLLEFAVGHGLDGLGRLPVVLQRQQQQAGDDPVAYVPLIFLFHGQCSSQVVSLENGGEQTGHPVAQADGQRAGAQRLRRYLARRITSGIKKG